MPYIPKVHREKYDRAVQLIKDEFNLSSSNAGQLNYLITQTVHAYIENKGISYQTFNDVVGALEGAKLELYRRGVAPYEDHKIRENGDLMKPSKYLDRFKKLAEAKGAFQLTGSAMLVESIPEEEMKKGSIILAKPDLYKETLADSVPIWVRILSVGPGYYGEGGEDLPLEAQPGDIALVGKVSVQWFSVFGSMEDYDPQTIGITREEEIKLRFKGEEGYNRVFETLNQGSAEEGSGA